MKKRNFVNVILTGVMLGILFTSVCGEKVTADNLMKEAQENVKNVKSYKGAMTMDMELGMQVEGEEDMSMHMSMDTEIEMVQDPMMYYMDASIDVDSLGMAMDMKTYGEVVDNQMVTYVNVLGGWQKTTAEVDLEQDMSQMIELDAYIMEGKELTLAEKTETCNEKEVYVITTVFTGEDFEAIFQKVMETMSEGMGGMDSLEDLGMDINYDEAEMEITYKIYKEDKMPAEVRVALTENSKFLMTMEGVEMSYDKLDCVISYKEFDTIESIEIPEEARNAEELTDEFGSEAALEQDENGNYLLHDTNMETSIEIPALDGYKLSEYADATTVILELSDTKSENHTCEINYYLTKLESDWTAEDIEESYKSNAEFYTEEYGYEDPEFTDVQTMKVGNYDVKYVTVTYFTGGEKYKECNAWTILDNDCALECWFYESEYDDSTGAVNDDLIKAVFESVQ